MGPALPPAAQVREIHQNFLSRHPCNVNRHSIPDLNLASPQTLRLGMLVLLLITVNQVNEPLVDPTYGEAFLYWGIRPLVLAGGLWLADRLVARTLAGRWNSPAWLKPVALVTAIGLMPLAITEALLELQLPFQPEFLDEELWAYSPVLAFLGEYVTLASIVIPLHLLLWIVVDRNVPDATAVAEVKPANPAFLERLGNTEVDAVLALQAEEHYLRVVTEDSAELIHYRFGDAIEEMPVQLGLRVHRSWWVADRAVRAAKRGQRRWQLNLVNGDSVPVSDSYVKSVRERGWLKRKAKL